MVSPNWILLGCVCLTQLNGACMQYSGTKLFAVIVAVTVAVAVAKRQQLNEFIKILSMKFHCNSQPFIHAPSICTFWSEVFRNRLQMLCLSILMFSSLSFVLTFEFSCRKHTKHTHTHTKAINRETISTNTNDFKIQRKTFMQHIYLLILLTSVQNSPFAIRWTGNVFFSFLFGMQTNAVCVIFQLFYSFYFGHLVSSISILPRSIPEFSLFVMHFCYGFFFLFGNQN